MTGKRLPLHTTVENFKTQDDCLIVGEYAVTELAFRAGQTPFYAYDRSMITKRIAHLRRHLPAAIHLHYAIKANPMQAVVDLIRPLVDGLDIASAREMQVALNSGQDSGSISFAGPGKTTDELTQAVAARITITVESAGELERAISVGNRLGITPRIAVRVNPDFELKTSGMKMTGGPKPFGIDAEMVPDVLRTIDKERIHFAGFHIFCGSQNLSNAAIIEAQSKSYDLALSLCAHIEAQPDFVNLGGGFGIPYFPGDKPLDIQPIGDNLERISASMKADLPETLPVVELGRYIVGEAGVYICRIIDRKISRGRTYLVTDGGLHHHLSASGNFGQIIRKNFPALIANKVFSTPLEKQTIVGPLCTPLDLLADRMEMARGEVGDLVAIFQSGAYGLTASPINFLSHPVAIELLC